jgi:hypothetical protein
MGIWTTHRQRQAGRYAKASYQLARREAIANDRAREIQRLATRTALIRRRNELLAELAAQTPPRPDLKRLDEPLGSRPT